VEHHRGSHFSPRWAPRVAGRALDSELGATGPAVVGASFAVLPLILTIAIASLQRRALSGGRP